MILLATTALVAAVLATPPLRRPLLTRWLMKPMKGMLPSIGETERIALEAGDVWLDADLFSGKPDWKKLLTFNIQPLTAEEQAFLSGPVEDFLNLFTDWDVIQNRDLPKKAWDFLKKEKFFGIIIPKEHGGLGFSAAAHAAIVTKISTRSITAAVTVMVPNSLGPAELLLHYGTDAQKKHYLPRLANGRDLPCFGLTEPTAGSDAASLQSHGEVVWGKWNGKKTLGVNLNFAKRYITLAPVATVVGLAFNLNDPQRLVGDKEKIGITLALLPRNTPGLIIGPRHDPLGVPFQNGPVVGKNVFIPMDYLVGGAAQAGNGWRMLMECLAAGRGISLPSLSVGGAQLAARATAAHATVREQFGLPVGKFEGVRERLARIGGHAYFMHAARRLTTGGLDAGRHPSVLAAIAKGYLTEGMRLSVNDAMDIFGGSGIMRGPNNIFASGYAGIPIGITVEGANILTRTLIIFGQGALRCHPFLQKEVDALQARDLKKFDAAFFGHIVHALKSAARAFVHGATRSIFVSTPRSPNARAMRQLSRLSAAFAMLTELGLLTLGGNLKRKEYLTGRYADALAWLYLASATLKRDSDEGHKPETRPLVKWVMAHALYQVEQALLGIAANLPSRVAGLLGTVLAFPLGTRHAPPSDKLTDAAAEAMLSPTVRDLLSPDVFIPAKAEPGLGMLEDAYRQTIATDALRRKLAKAVKDKAIARDTPDNMAAAALKAGLLTKTEVAALAAAAAARLASVQVNAFPVAAYLKNR